MSEEDGQKTLIERACIEVLSAVWECTLRFSAHGTEEVRSKLVWRAPSILGISAWLSGPWFFAGIRAREETLDRQVDAHAPPIGPVGRAL